MEMIKNKVKWLVCKTVLNAKKETKQVSTVRQVWSVDKGTCAGGHSAPYACCKAKGIQRSHQPANPVVKYAAQYFPVKDSKIIGLNIYSM